MLPTSLPPAVSRQGRGLGCGMIELDFSSGDHVSWGSPDEEGV